ncbi:protein of unknown function [Xaviernesmea oryzae]|uniref:DUF4387 domain-containing protein n=1 Tax=Xaviernesmea oryzae TaxID=464029 RepID=A0A1X7FPU7_9HYPH|nr:DUF4387 domain-containing protein [Xaviernesmea oryzae]SMF56348.1 protein of unknown function [Xaviernesmea oryzae]
MTKLGEIAKLIRSKNAGPFELTFDIMFDTVENYERVRRSTVLSAALISEIYHLPVEKVKFFEVPAALSFKASIPRANFQGDIDDTDSHGGQQYAPLIDIEIP